MAGKESLACLVYSEAKRKYYVVARQANRLAAAHGPAWIALQKAPSRAAHT
jgi:hypothetical protein